MKKLRMIVTSVVVLAIIGSAFAFNAKKDLTFCYSTVFDGNCVVSPPNLKKAPPAGGIKRFYSKTWTGGPCSIASGCTEPADFTID